MVKVEVAYATAERQWLLACEVPDGATVREALRLSGIAGQVTGLDIAHCPVGIFGKVVADAQERLVEEGTAWRSIGLCCSTLSRRAGSALRRRRPSAS